MADKEPLVSNWDMKDMVTVNEARADRGLAPLKDDEGKKDPAGDMTVKEYQESRNSHGQEFEPSLPPPSPSERKPFRLKG